MSAPVTSASPSGTRPPRLVPRPVLDRRPSAEAGLTLALALLITAVVAEAGGGLNLGPTTTVEIGLQLIAGVLGAAALLCTRDRLHGGLALAAFALLAGVTIASIGWAVQPTTAWEESARTLTYLATFATGIALVRLAPERWASLLWATLIATVLVAGYALATKVFPGSLAPDETYARLREPFGYWNAVGLMAALGVPGCLWLGARRGGHAALSAMATPLLGLLLVAVLLAYSRGSILAAVAGAAFWFIVVPLRLRAVAVFAPAVLGAGLVSVWAFGQDALSKDKVPLDLRTSAGHELGLALFAMLLVLAATGLAVGFARSRRAPSLAGRRRAAIAVLVALALVPVAFAAKLSASDRGLGGSISHSWTQLTDPDATTPANDPGRLTAVGSVRATYYDQALKIYRSRELYGAGAGGFGTARARFRKDGYEVQHAHGYVFQTLSDLGLIGLTASLLLLITWGVAAARATGLTRRRARRGPFGPERVGLLTLTSTVVVFGVHSVVDWTWFIPGTAVLALLCAGWVAGRGDHRVPLAAGAAGAGGLRERLRAGTRNRPAAATAAAAVVVLSLTFAWATWQPQRSVHAGTESLILLGDGRIDAAREKAQQARDMDPLSIDPLLNLSIIETAAGRKDAARDALEDAVALQPQNPTSWLVLAEYDINAGDPQAALRELRPALYLDPRSTQAVTLFLDANRQIAATKAAAEAAAKTATEAARKAARKGSAARKGTKRR